MPNPAPAPGLSFLQTVRAVAVGFAPRVLEPRGWVLCALALSPVLLSALGLATARQVHGVSAGAALQLFHGILVSFILPLMALVAAPGGIREDLEERTLPLLLARPLKVWALPLAKGLAWYGWGALWLLAGCWSLLLLGASPATLPLQALALVLGFWAELSFMTLLGLLFTRGALWGALVLFGWENALGILPGSLQRFTFLHHIRTLSGAGGPVQDNPSLLGQPQVGSPLWLSACALLFFGILCWGLAGWKLQNTPLGLGGMEGEG